MPRAKKTYKIKRSQPKGSKEGRVRTNRGEGPEEEADGEAQPEQNPREETVLAKGVKLDPRSISNLPDEQRTRIKSDHPEINEYYLMSAREKSKFFHFLNQRYRQDMKLAQPPGSAPMRKTIKFKKRFEIRAFSYDQKCEEILGSRSFMQLYKARDDAKPKQVSKLLRNA